MIKMMNALALAVLIACPGLVWAKSKAHENQDRGARVYRDTTVYRGASTSSSTWGRIDADTEVTLLSDKTTKGFFKVLYKGKVGYIEAGALDVPAGGGSDGDGKVDDKPDVKATPTPKPGEPNPTPQPTPRRDSRRPGSQSDYDEEDEEPVRANVRLSKRAREKLARERSRRRHRRHSSGVSYVGAGAAVAGATVLTRGDRTLPLYLLYMSGMKGKEVRATVPFAPPGEETTGRLGHYGLSGMFGVDYRVHALARISLDFSSHYYDRLVAYENENGQGQWIADQTGGTDLVANPFTEDMYMTVRSTGTRLGLKLGLPIGTVVEPWVGGGIGLYHYYVNFGDRVADLTVGEAEGDLFGLTWMAGVDFKVMTPSLFWSITPFVEGDTPVADMRVEDLVNPGWTWEGRNVVMPPIRVGVSLGVGY